MPRSRIRSVPSSRPAAGRRRIVVALATLVAAAGCGVTPSTELDRAELLLGITDAVANLREENAALQEQVDALEIVVARQDSLLRRVAAANGIPVAP